MLHVGDVADDVLGAALGEDRLAHAVELEADLVEDREAVVEELREDLVENVSRALAEVLLAPLLIVLELREQAPERLQRHVGQRHDVVVADEDVQLGRVEPRPLLVVVGHVEHDEHVVVVLVDLGPLPGREHVLEIQLVELEVLRQPGGLDGGGLFQLQPAQAGSLDLSDPRLGALDRPLRRALAPSYCPRDPGQVRHRGSPSRSGRPCLPFYPPERLDAPPPATSRGGRAVPFERDVGRDRARPPSHRGRAAARPPGRRVHPPPIRGGSTGSRRSSWPGSTPSPRWGWPCRCSGRLARSRVTRCTPPPRRPQRSSRGPGTPSSPGAARGSWRPATRAPARPAEPRSAPASSFPTSST